MMCVKFLKAKKLEMSQAMMIINFLAGVVFLGLCAVTAAVVDSGYGALALLIFGLPALYCLASGLFFFCLARRKFLAISICLFLALSVPAACWAAAVPHYYLLPPALLNMAAGLGILLRGAARARG